MVAHTATELLELAARLDARGIRLRLVGGPVRDLLSGVEPNDLDVTSAATPAEFRDAINAVTVASTAIHVWDVSETHGTTGVAIMRHDGHPVVIEHTTHRTETYVAGSRSPIVTFGRELDEDLRRRDFTVNAIALDLRTGELRDPFGGEAALADRRLRCPDDPTVTFSEDPLRIRRAVRFAAVRGFVMDRRTARGAAQVVHRLSIVSPERRRDEAEKVIVAGGTAVMTAVALAAELGVTTYMFGSADPGAIDAEALRHCMDPDAIRCAVALSSADPMAWPSEFRHARRTTHQISGVRSCLAAVTGTSRPEDLRGAVCRAGPALAALSGRVATLLGRSDVAERPAPTLAEAARWCAPLPVDGHDAEATGLKGPAVGRALRAVEQRFLSDDGLTRSEALDILAASRGDDTA